MVRYTGLNHIALATRDMDGTIRFWRDLLGMRLVAGLGRPGSRQYFLELSPTELVAFFEWPEVGPVPEKDHGWPARGPFVFDHVSFGVETGEMLWELKDRLEAAGIWVSEPIDHGFIHSIYTFDPNGIAIEFSHAVAGYDPHRTPRMADSAPTVAAMEGPEPRPGHWPEPVARTPPEERRVYPGQGHELTEEGRDAWAGLDRQGR